MPRARVEPPSRRDFFDRAAFSSPRARRLARGKTPDGRQSFAGDVPHGYHGGMNTRTNSPALGRKMPSHAQQGIAAAAVVLWLWLPVRDAAANSAPPDAAGLEFFEKK